MLALLPGLPLLAGLALLLGGRVCARVAGPLALATAAACLTLALWAAGGRPAVAFVWLPGMPFALAVDGLAAAMSVGAAAVSLAVIAYGAGDLAPGAARARALGLALILLSGMLLAAIAASLLVLFVAFEIVAFASLGLVGFPYAAAEKQTAARRVYLLTRIGDLGLLAACGAAFAGAGSLMLADLSADPPANALGALAAPWLDIVAGGIVLSALAKSAQLPLGVWTSYALAGRAHPAALLGAGMLVVSGGYLLLRTADVLAQTAWALPLVAWIGALSALALGLVASTQRDLKQVLAASTGAQKGLILMAIGSGAAVSGAGYILAHGFFKALLVVSASALFLRAGTADLRRIGARAHRFGGTRLAFALGAVILAGLPPFAAFVFKEGILAGALSHAPALYALGLAASLVTSLYALRMLVLVCLPRGREGASSARLAPLEESPHARAAPRAIPLVGFAIVAASAGSLLVALLGFDPLAPAFRALLETPAGPAPATWEIALSASVSLAGLAIVLAWRRSERFAHWTRRRIPPAATAALRRWLGLRSLVEAIARATMTLARRLAAFDASLETSALRGASQAALLVAGGIARADARAEDAGLRGTGALGVLLARACALLDARALEAGIARLAYAFGMMGQKARVPQTGSLHHYYAQASLGLGALALILVARWWL